MVNWMNECDARVVAMAIDTDGCIALSAKYGVDTTGYFPSVHFDGKNYVLVKKVGSLIDETKKISDSDDDGVFHIRWCSKEDIFGILEQIEPYLIVKREQALLLMEFCRVRWRKLEKDWHASYGEEERQLHEDICKLNEKQML